MSGKRQVSRRDFVLQATALSSVGASGWLGILRDAVERSRVQDKPLLTETAFNTFVVSLRRQGVAASQTFVSAAQTDLPKSIRDRFAMTSAQDAQLASMSPIERSAVVNAIQKGFAGANELRVKLPTTMTAGEKVWTVSKTPKIFDSGAKHLDSGAAEIWTVTATGKF